MLAAEGCPNCSMTAFPFKKTPPASVLPPAATSWVRTKSRHFLAGWSGAEFTSTAKPGGNLFKNPRNPLLERPSPPGKTKNSANDFAPHQGLNPPSPQGPGQKPSRFLQ